MFDDCLKLCTHKNITFIGWQEKVNHDKVPLFNCNDCHTTIADTMNCKHENWEYIGKNAPGWNLYYCNVCLAVGILHEAEPEEGFFDRIEWVQPVASKETG